MGITDKTRKLIWGKSGNRCAMCRHVLCIDATTEDDESIIGDECHIISNKENGPRFDIYYPDDKIDTYENLILLCRIHHKQVDDQYSTYTTEILKKIKENHEEWVTKQLDKKSEISPEIRIKRIPQNIPKYLKRITLGKEIFSIVDGAETFQFDNDELLNEKEVKTVGEFLDIVKDWGDLGPELDPSYRVDINYRLTNLIKELDEIGFWVFGAREKQKLIANGQETNWSTGIILVLRKSNSQISKINASDNF
ncbi:MAG: HNH endonuclease [Actinobacteria bacterium]|nr:HNH endonuclease [Cyanobacteriota bacterium]MCL5771765.1 HNH endonuclease [Actinomycetota bacterium]